MATLLALPPTVASREPPSASANADLHRDAIEELVAATGYPHDVVARVFHAEFAVLNATARVTDYLVLFAIRRAREALRASSGE